MKARQFGKTAQALNDLTTERNILARDLKLAKQTIATQQARIQAALEVYAGMEGFIPETAAEGYCLRIIDEMNKALLQEGE